MKQNYSKILDKVINCIKRSKLRAFTEVNKALLDAYWQIGKELSENADYGLSVVEKLSRDLKVKYPYTRGYSVANLWNMKRFYETYQKLQPVAGEFKVGKLRPVAAEPKKLQTLSGESQKLQTLSAELLFSISWSNHISILDLTQSPEEREFYLKMCLKEKWSNRELKRQLSSSLFERHMLVDRPEKVTALIPKHVAALDEKVRLPEEKESVGLILCKSKNHEEVRFALARTLSPVKVAVYKTKLPDKKLILQRLEQFRIKDTKENNSLVKN